VRGTYGGTMGQICGAWATEFSCRVQNPLGRVEGVPQATKSYGTPDTFSPWVRHTRVPPQSNWSPQPHHPDSKDSVS